MPAVLLERDQEKCQSAKCSLWADTELSNPVHPNPKTLCTRHAKPVLPTFQTELNGGCAESGEQRLGAEGMEKGDVRDASHSF